MTITSYASGADFLSRYDARLIGDLVNDDGSRTDPVTLLTNPVMLAMLSDAYGQIVSTIVVGGRYTLAQIDPTALSATAISYLTRLNCDLALVFLKRRRGILSEKDEPFLKDVNERLTGLKNGAGQLLGIADVEAQASVISMAQPQLIPICQRNTIRTRIQGYYPVRDYGEQQQYTNNGQ